VDLYVDQGDSNRRQDQAGGGSSTGRLKAMPGSLELTDEASPLAAIERAIGAPLRPPAKNRFNSVPDDPTPILSRCSAPRFSVLPKTLPNKKHGNGAPRRAEQVRKALAVESLQSLAKALDWDRQLEARGGSATPWYSEFRI
jgi:hypothetical protein